MIKVLIVDDSQLVRNVLTEILESDSGIKVIDTASNGLEALNKAAELKPDIITMDIEMPVMDGIEATRRITDEYSIPILVITDPEIKRKREVPFHAIKAGAVNVLEKPAAPTEEKFKKRASQIIREVKIVSSIKVLKRNKAKSGKSKPAKLQLDKSNNTEVIAIGSSIGGPKGLLAIFEKLPDNFSVPILVVQHIGKDFMEGLARWISLSTRLSVVIAKSGEKIKPGFIYFAPGGYHMRINSGGEISIFNGKPVNSCKPSIDVLFASVAESYNKKALGILLTGMGEDGAKGLLNIKKTGGRTIAQNEETSLVFGMPAKAIECGAVNEVHPLQDIITMIKNTGTR
ncbi:chemotaxis-specific protein-glutamate methyltransferase CheB [candidate division KSB1 bacterium]